MSKRKRKPGTVEAAQASKSATAASGTAGDELVADVRHDAWVRRHLRLGWWMLAFFLTVGIALETLHGFKVAWYLDQRMETRRLMWTLAHAHGTLFALIQIAFAVTGACLGPAFTARQRLSSWCLSIGALCVPAGFALGGLRVYGGDPGPGILAVPVGAFLMLFAIVMIAFNLPGQTGTAR